MVVHRWGDTDVDWEGIDRAAQYIGEGIERWGLGTIKVMQYKEKWGTVRVYVYYHTAWYKFWYARFIYRLFYKRALKKWPHLRDEILEGADWPELLKGL